MGSQRKVGVSALSFNLAATFFTLDKKATIIEGELGSTTTTHRLATARGQAAQRHPTIEPVIHLLSDRTQLPALLRQLVNADSQQETATDFIFIDLPSLGITADSTDSGIIELLDRLILVTTAQPQLFHATTESLWQLANQDVRLPIELLINKVKGYHESQYCFQRLQQEVAPSLRLSFDLLGCVSCDNGVDLALMLGKPLCWAFPDSPATLNLRFLVSHKLQHVTSTGRIDRLLWRLDPIPLEQLQPPAADRASPEQTEELATATTIEAAPYRQNSQDESSILYRALRLAATVA